MKKAYSIVTAAVLLIAALFIAGCGKDENPQFGGKSDGRLIEQAYATAADINNNSELGGRCRLLGQPDERPYVAMTYYLGDGGEDSGTYYYYGFDGKTLVTCIALYSPEYSVFGIRPGDEPDASKKIIEDKGFSLRQNGEGESDGEAYAVYDKGYVSIALFSRDGGLTWIRVSANDPDYDGVDY